MSDPIRIVIADDHPVVRRGLAQFFDEEQDFVIAAQCSDGEEALEFVRRNGADVLIVDLRMPRVGGLDVLRQLRESGPPVIVLAGNISNAEVTEAMRLGAKGVVLKEMAPDLLVRCVRKVAAGGVWLEMDAVSRAMDQMQRHDEGRAKARSILTPRELEIVRMVSQGLGNREVGEKLFISEGTVKTHLHAIYEKLGLKGRVQLARYAHENGLE